MSHQPMKRSLSDFLCSFWRVLPLCVAAIPSRNRCYAICLGALLVSPSAAFSAEVPDAATIVGWRGDWTGLYPHAHTPTQWDADQGQNLRWQTKVGQGQASPIVAGDRILCTAEPELLLCLERTSGKILWSKDHRRAALPTGIEMPEERPPTSPNCGYAAPTPMSDGRRVYAVFGTGIVACYDLAGSRQWLRYLALPQVTQYGRSASPVLAGGRLLVSLSGLTAVDPLTGGTVWDAAAAPSSYGTPAIMTLGDVQLALTPQGDCVRLSDGKIMATKLASMKYTSPLVVGDVVYFADAPTVAYKLTPQTDQRIQCQKLWENEDVEGELFASPVCHDGLLYCVTNEGLLFVIDVQTGQTVYRHELEIRSASGKPGVQPANLYPSLTLVGKHLLLSNDVGETLVLAPGRQYREVGRNYLSSGCGASPAPDKSFLFLRGGGNLFCIGSRSP